ncbi:hypothetical protein VSH64_13405 [Amycolatopsis rhabdoformis]|uniref:Uncharacterized protein n=1 Tax=Amycolatopsis rhabdoformis TaxID=1448059 RepID=A0ABZ1IH65_9PSEU|nr:hypothetical protein [Amycolatopsis rhabdoformis]WSE33101.1 hypothetical protein VSH64_13405 [Amycolatopsis rhabdoformis]
MCRPSATLAVWSSAWLNGAAASDDVLDALAAWGEAHDVVAADAPAAEAFELPLAFHRAATPVQLLMALRAQSAKMAQLVLPVPGDVRGLGGGGPFAEAALRCGDAVVLTELGFGLVPEPIAEGLMRWTVYSLATPVPLEYQPLPDAEHGLTDAIRASAGALQTLDVASDRPGVRAELSAHLRSRPQVEWPAGTPARALRVLQRAEEISAILAIAGSDDPGGALSASAASRRAEALRPLSDAVRTARTASVNEAVRVFAEQADRQP